MLYDVNAAGGCANDGPNDAGMNRAFSAGFSFSANPLGRRPRLAMIARAFGAKHAPEGEVGGTFEGSARLEICKMCFDRVRPHSILIIRM